MISQIHSKRSPAVRTFGGGYGNRNRRTDAVGFLPVGRQGRHRSLISDLCSLISGFLSPVFCLLSSPFAQRSSLIPHPLPIFDLPTPNSTPRFLTSDLWSLISAVFLSPSTQPSRVAQKSDEGGSLRSLRSSVFSSLPQQHLFRRHLQRNVFCRVRQRIRSQRFQTLLLLFCCKSKNKQTFFFDR